MYSVVRLGPLIKEADKLQGFIIYMRFIVYYITLFVIVSLTFLETIGTEEGIIIYNPLCKL
jgi:hypothetical protein